MYTIKTLSAINPNYCYSHKVTQVDVDNVNAMVESIEKERECAITPQVGDMNTALRDMVGDEHSIMPGEDLSMDEKSFEKNIAGCEVSFTEDGFPLNYGGDCCYGKVAEIAET